MTHRLCIVSCCLFSTLTAVDIVDPRAEIMAADYRRYLDAVEFDNDPAAPYGGGRITSLTDGNPAQRAGLRVGDIILTLDGLPSANSHDHFQLRQINRRRSRSATFRYRRGDTVHEVTIPFTRPEGLVGYHSIIAVPDPSSARRPMVATLLAQAGYRVDAEERGWLYRLPPAMTPTLEPWLQGNPPEVASWAEAFLAWFPLVLGQRWEEARARWDSHPPLRDDLPIAWQRYLRYLHAVTSGDETGMLAHGAWYHIHHYPHRVHLLPLGEPIFRNPEITRSIVLCRNMGLRSPDHMNAILSPDISNERLGRARNYMQAVACSLTINRYRYSPFHFKRINSRQEARQTRRALEELAESEDVDHELRLASMALIDLKQGNIDPLLAVLERWHERSPITAYLLARRTNLFILVHAHRHHRRYMNRLYELGVMTPPADDRMVRMLVGGPGTHDPHRRHWYRMGGYYNTNSHRYILRPAAYEMFRDPSQYTIKQTLWMGLLDRDHALMRIEHELHATTEPLTRLARFFLIVGGFEDDAALHIYRRELLRSFVTNVFNTGAEAVAGIDMAFGDQTTAIDWQKHAIARTRPNRRQQRAAVLEGMQAGRREERRATLWEMGPVAGGTAGRRTDGERAGAFFGPLQIERGPWTLTGWMVNDLAAGPWRFESAGVRLEGHFYQGRPVGPWLVADGQGRTLSEGLLFQGKDWPQAQRIGWWRFHDPERGTQAIGPFAESLPCGHWWTVAADGSASEPRPWADFAGDPTNAAWLPRIAAPVPAWPDPRPEEAATRTSPSETEDTATEPTEETDFEF